MHRRELVAEKRDARRDIPLHGGSLPETCSDLLVNRLIDSMTGPSTALMREEKKRVVQRALAEMEPLDREALMLRHFEQLASSEAAEVLGIQQSAAHKRYQRALERIRDILAHLAAQNGAS